MPPVCIKCILFLFLFSHIASTLVCISAIIIIIVSSASLPQVSVLLPLKFAMAEWVLKLCLNNSLACFKYHGHPEY